MYVAYLYVVLMTGSTIPTDTPDAPTQTEAQCVEQAKGRAAQMISTGNVMLVGIECERLPEDMTPA